jgi:hypothetical protein
MQNTDDFTIQHSIDNGIERVTCTPKRRRFETPILMHMGCGTGHGAGSFEEVLITLQVSDWTRLPGVDQG